jgi:hypothetical protein
MRIFRRVAAENNFKKGKLSHAGMDARLGTDQQHKDSNRKRNGAKKIPCNLVVAGAHTLTH